MKNTITINYYNDNAVGFAEDTKAVDFADIQQIFLEHLSENAAILDFGCGSGRDTKYFLDDENQYDGIWACASILHLPKVELPNIFYKMLHALKSNGEIYTSFKYGTFEGERNGRYFTDFIETEFIELIRPVQGLRVEKMWVTRDVREGRCDERWLNILLRKEELCKIL